MVESGNTAGLLLALVKLFVPKSTWRYSALTLHCGMKNHSTPPPAVHPVIVPLLDAALKLLDGPKVPRGKLMKSENVGFAKAAPPVAKNSHWPLAMPTRPRTVDNQRLLKDSVKGAEFRPNAT